MRKSKSIKSRKATRNRKTTRKNKSIKYRKYNRKIKGGMFTTAAALLKESLRKKSDDEKTRDAIDTVRMEFMNNSNLRVKAEEDVKTYSEKLKADGITDAQTILDTAKNENPALWHKMMALLGK
jgi:hypothetical protein